MTTSITEQHTETAPLTAKKKPRVGKRRAHVAPSTAKPAGKARRTRKALTGRQSGKTDKILDLLGRPGGVTLKELMKATDWQAHSVRGFISGTIRKKMGRPIESSRRADGERAYQLSKQQFQT